MQPKTFLLLFVVGLVGYDPKLTRLNPDKGEHILKFKDFGKQQKHPFVIYCDFETFVKPIQNCKSNPSKSSTLKCEKFEPCGYGYQVVSTDARYTKEPVIYRGDNIIENFIESLLKEAAEIRSITKGITPMIITPRQRQEHEKSIRCFNCDGPFTQKNSKVRDHDHVSGLYREPACNRCNLALKIPDFIPVLFHNLRGFDSHLLCEAIGKFKKRNISCIPNTLEKYISFSLGDLRFIDSFQFLNSSLEKLVEDLVREGEHNLTLLKDQFPDVEQCKLLTRKVEFPYSYLDGPERFRETGLPSKEAFHNSLNDTPISDEDYLHAHNVWNIFDMQCFGDYHDLYLLTDVVLLACVFERFRNVCKEQFDFYPVHFYTSPGLSWRSALKMTNVRLGLLLDPDMFLFFENSIRGGVATIFHRMAETNNKYIPKTYKPNRESSYISYLDANNLYGWALSQCLPLGGFGWLNANEITNLNWKDLEPDSNLGYVLEVDLKYPDHLHDDHCDFPLAPTKRIIEDGELSEYLKELPDYKKTRGKVPKLVPDLNKTKYVLHYRNLQLYVQLGMEVTKIHRVLEFKQEAWLKPYIDFCTAKRKQAKSDFEKNLYKLFINSIYGQCLMNKRKQRSVQLIHTQKKFHKYTARPSYQTCRIFSEGLVAVECRKVELKMNHPLFVGFCVLDLSKYLMYDFCYNHLKKMYGRRMQILFTDMDSICFHVKTDDLYEDMIPHLDWYDTSNYPTSHKLYSTVNMKTVGKFKDETKSRPISSFVGLRSKMYSFLCDGEQSATAKEIKKSVAKHELKHHLYKKTLLKKKTVFINDEIDKKRSPSAVYIRNYQEIIVCLR